MPDHHWWWVVYADCPITARLQRERKFDVLSSITVNIEQAITTSLLDQWRAVERFTKTIESCLREPQRVRRLRRLGAVHLIGPAEQKRRVTR